MKWRQVLCEHATDLAGALREVRAEESRTFLARYAEVTGPMRSDVDLPTKRDFAVEEIGGAMANLILYQVTAEGEPTLRVVGQNVRARFSVNPIGMSHLQFTHADRRENVLRSFREQVTRPCGVILDLQQISATGRGMDCEVVGLPLRGDGEERFVMVMDTVVGSPMWTDPSDRLRYTHARHRTFIDLGAGWPRDFVDLVPDE